MPEQFKTRKGQKPVRIASTSGHVCIVGPDWKSVPDHLVPEAMKAGLFSKDLYDQALAEAKAEAKEEVVEVKKKEPKAKKKEEPAAKKNVEPEAKEKPEKDDGGTNTKAYNILLAINEVVKLAEAGKDKTEGGKKLLSSTDSKPMVGAVSELAGFKVSEAEINEAIG